MPCLTGHKIFIVYLFNWDRLSAQLLGFLLPSATERSIHPIQFDNLLELGWNWETN